VRNKLLHSLIERQIKRYLKDMKPLPEVFQEFIKAVDKAYLDNDEDRLMLERAFDLSSQELLQVNNELRKSEEKFRMLAESSSFAIMMHQGDHWIYANRAAEEISGYTEKELCSMHFWDIVHPDYREMVKQSGYNRQQGKAMPRAYEFKIIAKNGMGKWVSLTGNPIKYEDKPTALISVTDITERKDAEKERQQNFEKLRKALRATVQSISLTLEMKDPYTSGHQQRVSDLAQSIAKEMGLSADRQDFIQTASAIHDIGKISIPSAILSKPTKLSDLEFGLIKTHSQSGYNILKDIEFPWPVADVVLQHHERMNGSGYPQGLKEYDILLEARILAVADVVEAITFHRPYRPAMGIDFALEEISRNKGILYDADVVDACLKLFQEKNYTMILKK
jgi:PAS domain S-box-containing protein